MTHCWPCDNFPALLKIHLRNLKGLSHVSGFHVRQYNAKRSWNLACACIHSRVVCGYFCPIMWTECNCPRNNNNKVGRSRTLAQVFHYGVCCFPLLWSHSQVEACCVELLMLMVQHSFVAGNRTAALLLLKLWLKTQNCIMMLCHFSRGKWRGAACVGGMLQKKQMGLLTICKLVLWSHNRLLDFYGKMRL